MKKYWRFGAGLFLLVLLFSFAALAEEPATYILDATRDLPAMAQGDKKDGESEEFNDYFTIMYSAKNKIDGSNKTFDDGYSATQRLNFGGKTQPGKGMINTVRFTTAGPAAIKFWWVSGGDGRQFALYDKDGNILQKTKVSSVKNSLYISSFDTDAAGTYYLGVPEGSNYLFKLQVTVTPEGYIPPARAAWDTVSSPILLSARDNGKGEILVDASASVGYDGADELILSMLDAQGNEIAVRRSLAEADTHTLSFSPASSGEYFFHASLARTGEENKAAAQPLSASFVLPLEAPVITSLSSAGGGQAQLIWTEVAEATGYEIFLNGASCGNADSTEWLADGLTIGETHAFSVRALRNEECSPLSEEMTVLATQEAKRPWSFTVYGPSTNEENNGYLGDINEEGFVTVYSENGKGKIQPNADDGLAFYYTAIPAHQNFSLRARVHVESWGYSNGQEGFGLMAADSVPPMGTESFFTNQYMALASKIEFHWQGGKISETGTKYSMRLGLGMLSKLGRTPDTQTPILGYTWPLETSAVFNTVEDASSYNIIGNNTNRATLNKTAATIQELTDFILEIQKNNTGYFITYYDEDGSIIGQYKDYDPQALTQLDKDYVYVGFFAARRARATFSDMALTVVDPAADASAEEKPVTRITPALSIVSGANANSEAYTLSYVTNVYGMAEIRLDGESIARNIPVHPEIRNDYLLTLPHQGEIPVEIILTPDEKKLPGEDAVLTSNRPVWAEGTVTYSRAYAGLSEIYVSPKGNPSGLGTREKPLSLSAAIQYVQPGQTIILMEGTYHFMDPLRIPHGMDGTKELPIRMIADPQSQNRPVLDFRGLCAGIIHGGDYWYFSGFNVTGAANGQKGFQVSGHYNTLENIHAHHNGNTGIQISRYAGSDPVSEWPSHNLILHCTAWGNADAGYEDADGFAAKLTCGEGNIFDGCIAYHNADDGFDLYAKLETGPIGPVVIRNCVAYANGFLEDGTSAGNGNGFKLGGSNMPGGHHLIQSYAFFNKSKGIDSNSCPDAWVENCISYNNLRYNVAFYTNIEQDTAYRAAGVISLKDDRLPGGDPSEGDEFKPKGQQNPEAYLNDTCYYWDGAHSVNASGDQVTADWFISLEFRGVQRHEDGTIDLQGFLELKNPDTK